MASVPYPQMAQGLQLQPNELTSLHDQSLINPLAASSNRPQPSLTHFYHEISKQSVSNNENTHNHNQFIQNENLSLRSIPNTIEII